MKEALRGYIVDQVPYPIEEEINDILALFEEKHFKKGGLYKEPFKTSDYVAFLCASVKACYLAKCEQKSPESPGLLISLP